MKYELCLNGLLLSDILPYPLFHCHVRLPIIRVCFTVCLMSHSFRYLQLTASGYSNLASVIAGPNTCGLTIAATMQHETLCNYIHVKWLAPNVYIYVHVYMYMYICICIFICKCLYICLCACACTCTHMHAPAHARTCTCTHQHMNMHIHMHTHTHTYIYIFKMAAASRAFHVWKYGWFIRFCLMNGNTKPLVAKWPCCFKDIFIY